MASDEALGEALSDWIRSGWMRSLPAVAVDIVGAAAQFESDGRFAGLDDSPFIRRRGGSRGPAWEPLSDEDRFHDETVEIRRRHEALVADIARQMGAKNPTTIGELTDLMVNLRLVRRDGNNEAAWWSVARPLPLPDDVVALPPDERELQDEMRWRDQHESNAQAIIRVFVDDERDQLTCSVHELAGRLGIEEEDARYAVLGLVNDGDFSTSTDVERVDAGEPFQITVDWDAFSNTRIGLQAAPSEPPEGG